MKDLIIVGAGGHAKVVADIALKNGNYNILGFIDSYKEKGSFHCNRPILGKEEELAQYSSAEVIIAVGDNWTRSSLVNKIKEILPEVKFAVLVHPSAVIASNVKLQDGVVVMPQAVINQDTFVGEHSIINTGAILEHDCNIGVFSAIQPGAVVGGASTVGDFSVIGLGANVIHNINIGNNSIIGAGAVVVNNIESCVLAYGVPAKVLKKRKPEDPYL